MLVAGSVIPALPLACISVKYTVSIEIAQPRERVVELLADPAQLPKWLRGLVLHEPLDGVHGQVGTTSKVVLKMGQQEMEATETITRREPVDLHGIPSNTVVHYDRELVAKGMWSAARERLTEAGRPRASCRRCGWWGR